MKKLLSILLAISMIMSLGVITAFAEPTTSFNDVPTDSWYYSSVTAVANAGLVNGTGNGNFSPNDPITLRQFITILARYLYTEEDLAGYQTYKSELPDSVLKQLEELDPEDENYAEYKETLENYLKIIEISDDSWWGNNVLISQHDGLFSHYLDIDDAEFIDLFLVGDRPCTREMMAAAIAWALDLTEPYDSFKGAKAEAFEVYHFIQNNFIPDIFDSSFLYSIQYVYCLGILQGIDENRTFDPEGVLTRAQACEAINKLINESARTPIDWDTYNSILETLPEDEYFGPGSEDNSDYYSQFVINERLGATVDNCYYHDYTKDYIIPMLGYKMPTITWTESDGTVRSNTDFEGDYVLEVFSDTCYFCRTIIPEIDAFIAVHPDYDFVSVSYDDDDFSTYNKETEHAFFWNWDKDNEADVDFLKLIPLIPCFIYVHDGEIVFVTFGYQRALEFEASWDIAFNQ